MVQLSQEVGGGRMPAVEDKLLRTDEAPRQVPQLLQHPANSASLARSAAYIIMLTLKHSTLHLLICEKRKKN